MSGIAANRYWSHSVVFTPLRLRQRWNKNCKNAKTKWSKQRKMILSLTQPFIHFDSEIMNFQVLSGTVALKLRCFVFRTTYNPLNLSERLKVNFSHWKDQSELFIALKYNTIYKIHISISFDDDWIRHSSAHKSSVRFIYFFSRFCAIEIVCGIFLSFQTQNIVRSTKKKICSIQFSIQLFKHIGWIVWKVKKKMGKKPIISIHFVQNVKNVIGFCIFAFNRLTNSNGINGKENWLLCAVMCDEQ